MTIGFPFSNVLPRASNVHNCIFYFINSRRDEQMKKMVLHRQQLGSLIFHFATNIHHIFRFADMKSRDVCEKSSNVANNYVRSLCVCVCSTRDLQHRMKSKIQ